MRRIDPRRFPHHNHAEAIRANYFRETFTMSLVPGVVVEDRTYAQAFSLSNSRTCQRKRGNNYRGGSGPSCRITKYRARLDRRSGARLSMAWRMPLCLAGYDTRLTSRNTGAARMWWRNF